MDEDNAMEEPIVMSILYSSGRGRSERPLRDAGTKGIIPFLAGFPATHLISDTDPQPLGR